MFGGGGGGGAPPPPVPLPSPPQLQDKAVQDAIAAQAAQRKKARGFRSTLLSSGLMDNNNPALKDTIGS